MDAPAIALRFRDTTPGIDTIAAHREILGHKGLVWWGWWKKAFEDENRSLLSDLFLKETPIDILIIDRSTKRMFTAKCRSWTPDKAAIDRELVPLYYRNHVDDVFGWFLLESIDKAEFDPRVAQQFGDNTLASLIDGKNHDSELVEIPGYENRSSILHLSDIHFGSDYAYRYQDQPVSILDSRRTLTECVISDLTRINRHKDIAAVIVTGDFVTRGEWNGEVRTRALKEFEALRSALALRKEQIFVVPGNHDIVRYPNGSNINIADLTVEKQATYKHENEYRLFIDQLTGRPWNLPLNYLSRIKLKSADLLMCALNSCLIVATEWTEYGYVGEIGLSTISLMNNISIERPTFKFMALHHHLLPVNRVDVPQDRGVSLSLDASILLESAQLAGVHIALHGHQHMPKLSRYQNIPLMNGSAKKPLLVVSNGSTGAIETRLPGNERNTYCVFELSDKDVNLWLRELRPDGKEGAQLFQGPLDIPPECH